MLTSTDTLNTFDSETCTWNSNLLTETAFCGKCAKKNTNNLFWNVNSTLVYKYVCYAYKLTKPFTQLNYQIIDPSTGSLSTFTINVQTIADNKWHYNCTDLTQALKGSIYATASLANLKVFQVIHLLLEFLNLI